MEEADRSIAGTEEAWDCFELEEEGSSASLAAVGRTWIGLREARSVALGKTSGVMPLLSLIRYYSCTECSSSINSYLLAQLH